MTEKIAKSIRNDILHMLNYSKSSHCGSSFSIVDILAVLYFKILNVDPGNPDMENRDYFILSKAHASSALFATLAEKGFFPKENLNKFYVDNGELPGHLDKQKVPGVETSGGSLGHGLSIGIGVSVANINDNNPGHVYVLLGDGECNEGSVWEAVMYAATHKLKNITAIVDYNKLQGFGRTNEIIDQKNIVERWKVFGWDVVSIDGHNHQEIEKALLHKTNLPKVIIANTVKGKGVSFMEDKLEWHYKSPNDEELLKAQEELEA